MNKIINALKEEGYKSLLKKNRRKLLQN